MPRQYSRSGEMRPCAHCRKDFYCSPFDIRRDRLYCSDKCRGRGIAKVSPRACEQCGATFTPRPRAVELGNGRFCKMTCLTAARLARDTRPCLVCRKHFVARPAIVAEGNGKYCSYRCAGLARHNRQPRDCRTCGETFLVYPSDLRRRGGTYCSAECYYNRPRRPRTPDERQTREYREWRAAVLERDRHTCQRCGQPGTHAHHVRSYARHPDLRLDVANGQTLCHACHKAEHPWMV